MVQQLPEWRDFDRVLSVADTAAMIGVDVKTLRRLVARGEGPDVVQLSLRRVGFRWSSICRWLDSRTRKAHAAA
jgi:predicted DNA-binding transcriptional regulator AlpA